MDNKNISLKYILSSIHNKLFGDIVGQTKNNLSSSDYKIEFHQLIYQSYLFYFD